MNLYLLTVLKYISFTGGSFKSSCLSASKLTFLKIICSNDISFTEQIYIRIKVQSVWLSVEKVGTYLWPLPLYVGNIHMCCFKYSTRDLIFSSSSSRSIKQVKRVFQFFNKKHKHTGIFYMEQFGRYVLSV